MSKSSESEQTRRVNATVRLLKEKASVSEVIQWLVTHYGVSQRQAYRYLRQAQNTPGPLPVPETKIVFTVKLPLSLIRQVRQRAHRQGSSISHWVEAALRRSLPSSPDHG